MCGIVGIYAFNEKGISTFENLAKANATLAKRGPDYAGTFQQGNVALAHARLSIIDVSPEGNQPKTEETGRYTIVFNGEIFNYKFLKASLIEKGHTFKSDSDTEVLLKLYIQDGEACLNQLNGFFAFAIYDNHDQSLFIARDRYGIKPLFIYQDEDKLCFASEIKALLALGLPKKLDAVALANYLHFNYVPAPSSMFENIEKFPVGNYFHIKGNKVDKAQYYDIPYHEKAANATTLSYEDAQKQLHDLLDDSVRLRLIADVPLGAFLSGGIDSSVIVALASKYTNQLNTFSIGYKDEPYFDETNYALLVADKYKTNHTVFSLTNDDLLANLYDVLDYLDEPFADSSALAVFILSKLTRQEVKVALSGDGADELFAGYNKYMGEYKITHGGVPAAAIKTLSPLWKTLPKSRNSKAGNIIRQLHRFAEGAKLSTSERYWRWAGFGDEAQSVAMLTPAYQQKYSTAIHQSRKAEILKHFTADSGINEVLRTDIDLVLQNDMLVKVDMMSMANSLEVRVPFLDYRVVDFAFSLPEKYKINAKSKKRIVQDAFRHLLPAELYNRPKHGFEVPLLKWFRNDLKDLILNDLLEDEFVIAQGVFDINEIRKVKQKLFSNNPEDVHARIWALIVFQYWWKKYFISPS
jgi:asparagine synthase (glutamine-hydrolysing)